jgi:hypothetical protein
MGGSGWCFDDVMFRAMRRGARAGTSCGGVVMRSGCPFLGSEAREACSPRMKSTT